jgi:N-methylhydantoinase B
MLSDGTRPHPKSRTIIEPGDRLMLRYGGGAGYGDPARRERASIETDVEQGYVSAEAAKRDYDWS